MLSASSEGLGQDPQQQQENASSFYKRIPTIPSISGLWLHWADLYGLLYYGMLSNGNFLGAFISSL